MDKRSFIIAAAILLCLGQSVCQAKRKSFEDRTVVYKGEHMVGLGISYMNISSEKSDLFLTVTDIDAKGSYLKIAPQYSYAFADNRSVGLRLKYSVIDGGADNLSLDLLGLLEIENVKLDVNTRNAGGALFYRRYIGLDRKGNAGFYLETALEYRNSFSQTGKDGNFSTTKGHRVRMNFSPGFILYIVPMASLHAQLGIANLSYNTEGCYKDGEKTGSLSSWRGGVGLNLMDLMFGVTYHF